MEEQDVNRLLNRLIEDTISREDFARIQGVMRVNPEVRAEYYELIGVDLMLSERYEVPTHISLQAKAMDDHWVVRRSHRKMYTGIAVAAAACILLCLGGFYLFRKQEPAATLSASVNCIFTINGQTGKITTLKENEVLEVKSGVMSVSVGTQVEACVEGPAKVRLLAHEGKLELLEGSVFLSILPGGKGFEVHVPGGIIRDIGTKFGVNVKASSVETHVSDGTVEIDRLDGKTPYQVRAGESASWTRSGPITTGLRKAGRFVEGLPWDETIFSDDFNEPNGTLIDKKRPDTGLPWVTLMETNPSVVANGWLDTSNGPRSLHARFQEGQAASKRKVYIVNFSTRIPGNIWDKAGYDDAAERITFHRKGDGPLFSLVARASRNHFWQIKDETKAEHSLGSRVSALLDRDLTLSYDTGTGVVTLFDGSGTGGELLDQFKVDPGYDLDSLIVSNDEGGDVALENLSVRMLTYSQNGERPPSR